MSRKKLFAKPEQIFIIDRAKKKCFLQNSWWFEKSNAEYIFKNHFELKWERYTSQFQILECLSIGQYWNIYIVLGLFNSRILVRSRIGSSAVR